VRCPTCDWEAIGDARFCAQCGAGLAPACASCGQTNPPGARFCVGCGARQGDGAEPVKKTIAAGPATSPERRLVTVMFCDLADSTRLSTELDPEDYREVISAYHHSAASVIERLGGFVAKYMGDGVLAYFGYPAAHEDDAERGVRAALALAATVEALETCAGRLQARIGLATGWVIVGDLIGEGSAREQAIAGETPNLAARLQSLADRGGIVISASTRELTSRLFDYEDLGAVELKGFSRHQPAFRVRAANDQLGRFEALRSTRTPLVGREEELEILLRRWDRARDGEPQVVLIRAEPGVGKSRLVAAFRDRIKGHDHHEQIDHCAPRSVDSPLSPTIRALESRCSFVSTDTPPEKLAKLEAMIRQAQGRIAPVAVSLLASLLSLAAEGRYPPLEFTPRQIKDETVRLLVQLSLRDAEISPGLHVIEDAHWNDPSSLELLRAQSRALGSGIPIMMVLTYRPEFQPPAEWMGQPNVTNLTLSRLRNIDAKAMVARVAAGKRLPEAVVNQILDHADGVPLFIEEITRTVLEGASVQGLGTRPAMAGGLPAIAVPATLQASLLARLDRLGPVREIAQIGAAIGREFPHALLAAVAERSDADLDKALRQLIEADLIFPSGAGADAGYVFKHALILDIAYGALLRGPRQALHGQIAGVLKRAFSERVETHPELLAHHLSEAGQAREAADAWRAAAIKTLRGGSWKEGLAQLDRGLKAARSLAEGVERDRLELGLRMMIGGVSMGAVGHSAPGVTSAYESAYALARRLGDRRATALAGSRLWIGYYGAGDLEGALRSVDAAYDGLPDTAGALDRALVKSNAATPLGFMGRFVQSKAIAEATTPLLEDAGSGLAPEEYYFMSPLTQPRTALLVSELALGRLQSWKRCCAHLTAELPRAGTMAGLIYLTMLIYTRYLAGDWEGLRGDAGRMAEVVSEIEGAEYYLDLVNLAQARLAVIGGEAISTAAVDRILERPSVSFAMQHLPRYLLIAGDIHAQTGADDRARACFEAALDGGPCASQQWLRSELLRRLGHLAVRRDPAAAERLYREAIAVAREQEALLFELRGAMALMDLSGVSGRVPDAPRLTQSICERFEEPCAELDEARTRLGDFRSISA